MNDTPVENCCEKCAIRSGGSGGGLPKCSNSSCSCHTKTISTGGDMVYVKAPPFYEPAQAISQSIYEESEEDEFKTIKKSEYEKQFPPKGDVNMGWEKEWREIIRSYINPTHSGGYGIAEEIDWAIAKIKSLLLSARAEEQKHFIDLGFEELNKAEEKGRAEERERVVALIEGMRKASESIVKGVYRLTDGDFADLLTRMRGVKE